MPTHVDIGFIIIFIFLKDGRIQDRMENQWMFINSAWRWTMEDILDLISFFLSFLVNFTMREK